MVENLIGFLWGVLATVFTFDMFMDNINIGWYYILIIIFVLILTGIGKIYLFVTDYKAMAETGISTGKKVYTYFINKKKLNKTNE